MPHLGSDSLEVRNTGLRPNWASFWALESNCLDTENSRPVATPSLASSKSAMSGGTGGGIRHIRLITGSEWIGEWDRTGMSGMGMYKMPHGVIYEGTMKAGLFDGIGVLKYPNGSSLEGLWYQGRLKYWQFDYADGLERDCHDWTYCSMPDRRFFSEHVIGFRPATSEQLANEHPAREVPPGHYDVGQGFFNPKTHCVVDAITGEVLSIPTVEETKWILEKCRSAEPAETVGYRPDLFENWHKKPAGRPQKSSKTSEAKSEESARDSWWSKTAVTSDFSLQTSQYVSDVQFQQAEDAEERLAAAEKEILSLLQQEGGKLHPIAETHTYRRKHSLHDKLEGEQAAQEQMRKASFEGLLKKVLKEVEYHKHSLKTSVDSYRKTDTLSNESNLFRLTQIISSYGESLYRKKTASSSLGSGGALEQFKMLGKILPSFSLTKTFPYSHPAPEMKSSVETMRTATMKKSKSEESELIATNYEPHE